MDGRYRTTKDKNKSRYYLLLSVVFVVLMAKWGVPAMIGAISGPEGRRAVQNEKDIIPPQQPIFSALPEATNSANLSIEGYTEAGAEVELLVNDTRAGIERADESGLFEFDATLAPGDNRVSATAKDDTGNTSQSPVAIVVFDNLPVELTVESPANGNEYFGKTNQTIEVRGKVNKDEIEVLVNNSFALVEKGGSFRYRLLLAEGENTIKVIATDKAGNRDEAELVVRFSQ